MDDGAAVYRRFLKGDEGEFDELMKRYFRPLVFFVFQYLHDLPAAEDVAIDVFADLIAFPHRFRAGESLKTYLFLRGKSRALDVLRRRKILRFTDLSAAEGTAADEQALAEAVLADERKRAVHAAMAKLPEEMRRAVHLVYFEELTYDEAARVMGKKKKQVDNLLYRAKKELYAILGEEGRRLL